MLDIFWSVQKEKKITPKQWTMDGCRSSFFHRHSPSFHIFDWEKWMLCFDFQQIESVELNLWHTVLLSKQGASLWNDSEEWNRSCWDANRCMFLINKSHIWISEKSLLKEKLFAFYYTMECVGKDWNKSQFFQHCLQAFAHVKQTSDLVSHWPRNR